MSESIRFIDMIVFKDLHSNKEYVERNSYVAELHVPFSQLRTNFSGDIELYTFLSDILKRCGKQSNQLSKNLAMFDEYMGWDDNSQRWSHNGNHLSSILKNNMNKRRELKNSFWGNLIANDILEGTK
ncbi:hypothetical protein [Yersinia phage fHe-Yen9-03]|uniref:Uncharacterized protein n=1 Tax=Yersinia phage fHe-Yen9-03 TaxID=2052743 RepID=A0A2C9CY96_9CAUD|nr:hypothetical protein [Yersinia phage fHe-Yen9-03]